MNYTQCGSALALPYADGIAQTCVTSPPYYGLRDYGTARWEGGDAGCDHAAARINPTNVGGFTGERLRREGGRESDKYLSYKMECKSCGAKRIDSQIGLESTPAAYVAQIVAAMREVWRVLRDDGTLWLNLGSSFSAASANSGRSQSLSSSRVPAYGNDGTEFPDSQGLGYACSGLCDEHLADFQSHLARIADTYQQTPQEQRQRWMKDRGIELPGCAGEFPDVLPLSVLASTTLESWRRLRGECLRCDSRASALSGFGSGVLSGLVSARNLGGTNGKTRTSRTLGGRTLGKEPLDLAWGDYTSTIKPKDMIPVPWMVAMALQADGWYLRSDIIWSKANPMPESVTDRPTKAHEYVFLLAKQPRYYYDAEAIAETKAEATASDPRGNGNGQRRDRDYVGAPSNGGTNLGGPTGTRNARSVWAINTQPFSGAHFATMPPELARRCILAGTSARGQCPKCGAPWVRVVERTGIDYKSQETIKTDKAGQGVNRAHSLNGKTHQVANMATNSFAPSCECGAGDPVPQIVLDPFAGSGTTAMVALQNGRRAIGTELNPKYLRLQDDRTQVTIGLGL